MLRIVLPLVVFWSLPLCSAPCLAQETAPNQSALKTTALPPFGQFSKTPKIVEILTKEIETKDFQIPMKLKDTLALLGEKFDAKGIYVPLALDEDVTSMQMPNPCEVVVQFQPHPHQMSLASVLDSALAQIPTKNLTYLVRKGAIWITTKERASIQNLLREKVIGSFQEKPMVVALYTLADQTGAAIVIDPRAADKALKPVSATFANNASLASALTLVTDMVDLKMVVVGESIYVTTPEHAAKLRKAGKE
jgi:hypothetical protein